MLTAAIHVALTLGMILTPVVLASMYSHFRRMSRTYAAYGEVHPAKSSASMVFAELKSLFYVPPVVIAVGVIVPHSTATASDTAFAATLFCVLMFLLYTVLSEYHRVLRVAKKSFLTGPSLAPFLYIYGISMCITIPLLIAISAFTPDSNNAQLLFWVCTVLCSPYVAVASVYLAFPLERDYRFIKSQVQSAPILGDGLVYVDSMVQLGPSYPSRLVAVANHLMYYFADSLPRKPKLRTRLVEFAVNTALARMELLDIVALERCRVALDQRARLIGTLVREWGPCEVYVDVGAIRGRRIACIVARLQASPSEAPGVRCLDVALLRNLRGCGLPSSLPHRPGSREAQQFWDDAVAMEADVRSAGRIG